MKVLYNGKVMENMSYHFSAPYHILSPLCINHWIINIPSSRFDKICDENYHNLLCLKTIKWVHIKLEINGLNNFCFKTFLVLKRLKCILPVLKLQNNLLRTTASMVIPRIKPLLCTLRVNFLYLIKLISKLNFPNLQ